ncbi:ATP-binding protein [Streptomyces sp. RS10V-4]|uniref:ATP-binding protein n=1 Tax=Streptomyces rhizoryzae TaxID=2932493 RepID=UPI002006667E|nr:ATP-binding protein [Streptomyces rhizoryzae]MCK7626897.1 ATP-binding protein [Streptomyces rhizoryzae]
MHPDTAAVARPPLRVAAGARPYLLTAPSRPTAPKTSRDFVAAVLRRGPLAPLRETAVLLTSEAVTRAHLRTPPSADLLLRVLTGPGGLRISVHHEGPAVPGARTPAAAWAGPALLERDPAHGLLLISRLAGDWGTTPFEGPPHTTSLWFELYPGR